MDEFLSDSLRLEDRKRQAREQFTQDKSRTCDIISIGMINNYKVRCNDSIEEFIDLNGHFPSEILDYIKLLEKLIEPITQGQQNNKNNVNLMAVVQGIADEVEINVPILPVPAVQQKSVTDVTSIPFMNTGEQESDNIEDNFLQNILSRLDKLESEVRLLKMRAPTDVAMDTFAEQLEKIASSSFLD